MYIKYLKSQINYFWFVFGVFLFLFFGFNVNLAGAVWISPSVAPPNGNIAPPLTTDTVFDGEIAGRYNALKISIDNCTGTDQFLSWNGNDVNCQSVEQLVNIINNYYSGGGGGGGSNPITPNLLNVLQNGSNASGFSGNVFIGNLSSSTNASLDLGGPLKAQWLHSTVAGDNTFAGNILTNGNIGIGTLKNPGIPLQLEKLNGAPTMAGKYWSDPQKYNYKNKEIFNILAKVGTQNSAKWADGVAGKISFVGVTNNYIPQTDLVFSLTRKYNEPAQEMMRVTGDGQVGIGIASPAISATLHLYKNDSVHNAELSVQSSADGRWALYHDRSSEEFRFWYSKGSTVLGNLLSLKPSGEVLVNGILGLSSRDPQDTDGKLYNKDGDLYWSGEKIGAGVEFAGISIQGMTGNIDVLQFLNPALYKDNKPIGYAAADTMCSNSYAGSHLCTNEEIMELIRRDYKVVKDIIVLSVDKEMFPRVDAVKNNVSLWIASGISGQANDCDGWTSASSEKFGSYWSFGDNPVAYIRPCDQALRLACCY